MGIWSGETCGTIGLALPFSGFNFPICNVGIMIPALLYLLQKWRGGEGSRFPSVQVLRAWGRGLGEVPLLILVPFLTTPPPRPALAARL